MQTDLERLKDYYFLKIENIDTLDENGVFNVYKN